jgi:DNA-binding NarL/FixJ family response regulator
MRQTLLIVDDNEGFRSSARALLETQGFDVVGEAADGPQALIEVERLHPAIVLLDIQLPGEDGFDVAEHLATRVDPPIVVLISSRASATYARRLATTSARAFVPKDRLSDGRLAEIVG